MMLGNDAANPLGYIPQNLEITAQDPIGADPRSSLTVHTEPQAPQGLLSRKNGLHHSSLIPSSSFRLSIALSHHNFVFLAPYFVMAQSAWSSVRPILSHGPLMCLLFLFHPYLPTLVWKLFLHLYLLSDRWILVV